MVWDPKFRQENLTLKYLNENISYFEPNSTSLKGINIFNFDHNLYALLYQVNNFPIPLLIHEKENITRTAIQKIRDKNPVTVEDFRIALQNEAKTVLDRPWKKYFLVLPTKIKSQTLDNKEILVFDIKIKFVKNDYLKENFSFDEHALSQFFVIQAEIPELLNSNNYFLLIEQYGRNEKYAATEAFKKFELFRSILNFVADYQSYSLHFGTPQQSKSYFFPPKFSFLFSEDKKIIYPLITELQLESKELTSQSDLEKFNKYLQESEKIIDEITKIEDQKLKNLLITSFEIHCDALDYYGQKWICCFHLWQIIESISLYNKNSSYDQVSKRIISLLEEFHPWYDTIQLFLQKRNDFVHRGNKAEFTYLDINAIKGIVQFSMMKLLHRSNDFKDLEGLRYLYEGFDYFHHDVDITDNNYRIAMRRKEEMLKIIQETKIYKD